MNLRNFQLGYIINSMMAILLNCICSLILSDIWINYGREREAQTISREERKKIFLIWQTWVVLIWKIMDLIVQKVDIPPEALIPAVDFDSSTTKLALSLESGTIIWKRRFFLLSLFIFFFFTMSNFTLIDLSQVS